MSAEMRINKVFATHLQSSPPLRESVIAAAPASQNTHDRNRLQGMAINGTAICKITMSRTR
jgi:hypothetical protein